ncbi:MAG TPA: hypothetical protein VGR79_01075 [Stellaceae bacterium]|nr:hypothetical protein [Stellaceae bacterium]
MTERNTRWIAWGGIGLAGISVLLVAINIVFALLNARTQAEVAARQQFIADGPQYNAIGEALVHSLDAAAAATSDQTLIAMMQRHGLSPSGAASTKRTR